MKEPVPMSQKPTYQDIIDLPDNVVGEILNGELVVSPRPSPRHSNAASMIGATLGGPFQAGKGGPGGWWILDEPEIHWQGNVVVPDVAGWRKERLPKFPETAYFEQMPDWVCEVISPKSARHDRITKARIYADGKVPYYWIVDPLQKTLEVLSLKDGRWMVERNFEGADRVSVVPFETLSFDLSDLWAEA